MKATKLLISALVIFLFSSNAFAQDQELMAQFSLFNEYQKTDQVSAYPFGWTVINTNPEPFVRYKLFPKMEEVLFFMHDSAATTDEERQMYADTTLHFYDIAMNFETDKKAYYLARKAYVIEEWTDVPVDSVISAYKIAWEADPELDTYYVNRLGQILKENAADDNDYKVQAVDLYNALIEREPDNTIWQQQLQSLAGDLNELEDILYDAWQKDKENPEKAWSFVSVALKNQHYEKAVEGLEFLVEKSPDVMNYWTQLASSYRKLGQDDKAIQSYKRLVELQPDNRDNYLNLALMYKDMGQLSVARSYLNKASKADPSWDYPLYVEAMLYEQAARNCGYEFMDKLVYLLAANTYRQAANKGGSYSSAASERVRALSASTPSSEDLFFRKLKSGDTVKIEGRCYDWIGKSVVIP